MAKQTYIVTRSGAYVFGRTGPGGVPLDYLVSTRASTALPNVFATFVLKNLIVDGGMLDRFGIRPKFGPYSAHPSINGEFFGRCATGVCSFVCEFLYKPQKKPLVTGDASEHQGIARPVDCL